jgi:hypothetical protein
VLEDMLVGKPAPPLKPAEMPDEKGAMKPWHGNRKVCKQWLEDNPGAIDKDEYDNLVRMRDNVLANATARALVERGAEQVTLRGTFPGLPGTQSRPDWLLLDDADYDNVYVDLKKCQRLPKFRLFGVHDYGCNTQAGLAAHHLAQLGITGTRYYLLVVEEQFPNRAVLQELTPNTVLTGQVWCTSRLLELAEHYESGHWPLSINDVETLDAPVRGVELTGDSDGTDSK